MNYTEAIQEIVKVAPESAKEFSEKHKAGNAFMVINVFTKQIKSLIRQKDRKVLSLCLVKMNDIYSKGDQSLRNAIESVFIYSLDSLTFTCDTKYRSTVSDPERLKRCVSASNI